MIKYINNTDGIAIVMVIYIVSISFVITSLIYYILNSEIIMNNDSGDIIISAHLAETGADLIINEWIKYINSLKVSGQLASGGHILPSNFRSYCLTADNTAIMGRFNNLLGGNALITYEFSVNGTINNPVYDFDGSAISNLKILLVEVVGKYNKSETVYHVKLKYCHHGAVWSYKGE
jgi:hypothetical protein